MSDNDFLVFAFDPGITTGFAAAWCRDTHVDIFDVRPIYLVEKDKKIKVATPPIDAFAAFTEEIIHRVDTHTIQGCDVYCAIENFLGGIGGDVQNTVNKLIGIISAVFISGNKLFAYGTFKPIKIYKNTSRYPYRELVDKLDSNINHHSKDALMHLMHRIESQVGAEKFKTLVFSVNTTCYE